MNSLSWIFSLLTPILLHMILSEASVILLSSGGSTAVCTTMAAVLTIPAAAVMFFRDRKKSRYEEVTDAEKTAFFKKDRVLFGGVCLVLGGIMNIVWSGILNFLQIGTFFSNAVQEDLLASEFLLQIIGLGVLVPIAEELIFRALIYNRMKTLLSARLSIFFSALLFAVYHGNPIQIIFAFPMALVMTGVYEKGQHFIFPVLFHIGANLTAVLMNLI